jgi:hypothetical protein
VVGEDWYIRDSDGELVTLAINGKSKPMVVFNDNMTHGDYSIVNPMVEITTATTERIWYFDTISRICGGLVHNLMDAIIGKIVSELENKGEGNFTAIEQFSDISSQIDDKMIGECGKLHANNILRIFYSGKEHIAQAQTDLDSASYIEELKIRKKSFGVFQSILCTLLDTTLEDLSKKYSYKSKHIGFGKTDAMLHLYVMVLEALHPFVKVLLPEVNHYDLADLMAHLENLKAYNKDCAWFASGSSVRKIEEEPTTPAPWQQVSPSPMAPNMMPMQPVPQVPMYPQNGQPPMMPAQPDGQMIPMPITALVRPKPFYQQPSMVYPGYGQGYQQPQMGYAQPMAYPQQVPQPMMQQPQMGYMQQPMMYPPQQQQPMQPYGGQPVMYQPPPPINTQSMSSRLPQNEIKYSGGSKIKYK